jgi:uncharacterized delta-60 repeat protein
LRSALAALLFAAAPTIVFAQLDTAWLRQYDGGEADEDWMSGMAVDRLGNVFTCGTGYTGNLSTDIILQKWTAAGALEWTVVHSGDQGGDDSAAALVVDTAGNVFVAGMSAMVADQARDAYVAKYSPAGVRLWQRVYARGGLGDDAALAICLVGTNRVAVTGYSAAADDPYNLDVCTMMMNAETGDTFWVQTYNRTPENEEDVGVAICADPAGNVYVTGYSYDDGTDLDIVTMRYAPDGSRTWLRRRDRQFDEDYGVAIAWNPVTSNVTVGAVVYTENQDFNYLTIAYNATGDSVWAREYNRYPSDDEDLLTALVVDAAGNTIVTGMSYDAASGFDCATVAYGPAGAPLWVTRYDRDGLEDGGLALAVDSLGQVLVTGFAETRATDYDVLLMKLAADGSTRWAWALDGFDGEDIGQVVRPRPDGTILLAGTAEGDLSLYDLLVCRLVELSADFAARALIVPDSIYLGDSVTPRLVVRNNAMYAGDGWARFRAGGVDIESLSIHLEPQQVDTVTFGAWYPDTVGVYRLAGRVTVAGDERPGNDTAFAMLRVWGDTAGIGTGGGTPLAAGFRLYPNPARGAVSVRAQLAGGAVADVRLYDVAGAVVRAGTLARTATGDAATRLDVTRLPAGVYFCRLEYEGQEVVRKLVLQR